VCGSNFLKEELMHCANLCHKGKGKEWANLQLETSPWLSFLRGNESLEQTKGLKMIENDVRSKDKRA